MAGAAPGLAAGRAGRLPARVGEMQTIVADQARALEPRPQSQGGGSIMRIAGCQSMRTIRSPLRRLDQHLVAMHRGEERQSLHPVDRHPQSVVVAQIVELGGVFALDGGDPHGLALAVGLRLFAGRRASAASFICAVRRRSSW